MAAGGESCLAGGLRARRGRRGAGREGRVAGIGGGEGSRGGGGGSAGRAEVALRGGRGLGGLASDLDRSRVPLLCWRRPPPFPPLLFFLSFFSPLLSLRPAYPAAPPGCGGLHRGEPPRQVPGTPP